MIETGLIPILGVVANGAIRRESCGLVVGIVGSVEIGLVAGNAVGGCTGKTLIVTGNAIQRKVSAVERELCLVVVESGGFPRGSGVADGAVLRELIGHVIGIGNAVEIGLMAGNAVGGCTGETLIVTGNAIQRKVSAVERELCLVVVESGGFPCGGGVADGAVVGELVGHVVGIGNAVKIGLVTGNAVGGCTGETLIVTGNAIQRKVSAVERELCLVVVESGGFPRGGGVADGAVLRELIGHVVGVGNAVKIGLVTGNAVGRGTGKTLIVTGNAIEGKVSAVERELCLVVVESGGFPCGGGVADGAVLGELVGHVVGVGNAVKIGLVTGNAVGGCTGKTLIVTGNAIQRKVSAVERELCLVVVEGGGFPRGGGVADGAVLRELIGHVVGVGNAVKIGLVTGNAVGGCTGKTLIVTGNAIQG